MADDVPGARAADLVRAYDAQGVHRTGLAADSESADWLAGLAKSLGAEVFVETFVIDRVEPVRCHVDIEGTRIPAVPVFDAPFTGADGLSGVLASAEDGEIGLVELSPRAVYYASYAELRRRPGRRAEIIVTRGNREGLALLNAESFRAPYGVPCVQVASQARDVLVAAAERGARVSVVAEVRRVPSTVRNVVATVKGSRAGAPALAVMTPRSGWWHCASERGGGIVCWLEALRALRDQPPAGNVTMVATTGHELGHIGLDDFLERRPALILGATWLHFGANIGAAGSKLTLQSPQDDLRALAGAELAQAGHPADGVSPKTQVPFGESRAIHHAGGRYLTLIGSNDLFHLPQDRWPAAVDVGAVARLSTACARIAVALTR